MVPFHRDILDYLLLKFNYYAFCLKFKLAMITINISIHSVRTGTAPFWFTEPFRGNIATSANAVIAQLDTRTRLSRRRNRVHISYTKGCSSWRRESFWIFDRRWIFFVHTAIRFLDRSRFLPKARFLPPRL